MSDGFDKIGDLVGSRRRVKILEIFRERGELTQRELKDELDCARTTVNRNLDQLQEHGWVSETPDGHEITTAGKTVSEKASSLIETIEAADYLEPILNHVSRDHLDIDINALRDAEITGPKNNNPVAMIDKHTNAVKQSDSQQLLLPITSRHSAEIGSSRVKEESVSGELIVLPEVVDVMTADPVYADLMGEILEHDCEMYIFEGEIPFYLGIFDSVVQIGVDDGERHRALLESESNEVRAWAEDKFAEYRAGAEPISEWPPADFV